MLGILFTMAGALCGIANGLYVGFTTAGSKRDCAAIVETDLATAQEDVSQLQDAASTEAILSSGPGGRPATSEEDVTSSAATGERAAAIPETDAAPPSVWLPAPAQVIGNNRDAEQTEFSAMVKAVWPARSQDDNERYIRSLKAKLEVALQKVKDLQSEKSTLSKALDDQVAAEVSLQKEVDMLRNVLNSRTDSTSVEQPAAESPAARAPAADGTNVLHDKKTDPAVVKKKEASTRIIPKSNAGQENVPQHSVVRKSAAAWRPPRPPTPKTAVTATTAAAAPKVLKPTKRRSWSWADEADLFPEEQARLLDEYLRANPDPFAKK